MKRIVKGVTYNTETSTLLAQYEWDNDDERGIDCLYQTRGGAFFIDEEVVKPIWNEREREHEERRTHTFVPKSPDDAHKWLLEIDNLEIFHKPFDDPPEATAEAEPGATIYVRVPSSLKKRVDDAAKEAKSSGNIWAMRCIERCLEEKGIRDYPDLAYIWEISSTVRAHSEDLDWDKEKCLDALIKIAEYTESLVGELFTGDRDELSNIPFQFEADHEFKELKNEFRPYKE
jgi:predicted HicB family RNase H-like nuclease